MKLRNISESLLLRITIAIWSVAYIGLCARTLFLKVDKASVYHDFSTAGQNWMNGDLLYNRLGKNDFRYSPLVAAFFVPLDLLPARTGEFLWRTLNMVVFLGGLYFCCRAGVPRQLSVKETCAVFLLCIPLAVGSLNNAQSNPLVLGLLLIGAGAAMQRRWTLCSIAITIATCFKLYPIAFGMLLVLMYPRRLAWRLFVCLTAAAVLPFVLQRAAYVMDQYTIWIHYLSTEDRQIGPITDWYRDLRALSRVYAIAMSQRTYLIVELAAGALIAVTCTVARLRKIPQGVLLAMTLSLACCWMTVLGPATESATYVLLAPAVAWGIVLGETELRPGILHRVPQIGYAVVFGLFLTSQLALNIGPRGKFFRDHLQPLPLAGLLLMILVWGELILDTMKKNSRPGVE